MKKNAIICGIVYNIVGLFLLVTAAVAVSLVSAFPNNCVNIDCLEEQFRFIYESNPKPDYLDCENILRCMDAGEQEVMRECVKSYPADNESSACNSQDLLARSQCDYTRGAVPK